MARAQAGICFQLHAQPPSRTKNACESSSLCPMGHQVLTIGGVPTLSLLLEGKVRIVRDLARDEDDYRRDRTTGEVTWLGPL